MLTSCPGMWFIMGNAGNPILRRHFKLKGQMTSQAGKKKVMEKNQEYDVMKICSSLKYHGHTHPSDLYFSLH